jgi:hypothetical protein
MTGTGSIAARSDMAASPRLTASGQVLKVAQATLATVAGLTATASGGPDVASLWTVYALAAARAASAWEAWSEMKLAGGTTGSAGQLYGAAYEAQMAADQAYAAYVTAQGQQTAGARG